MRPNRAALRGERRLSRKTTSRKDVYCRLSEQPGGSRAAWTQLNPPEPRHTHPHKCSGTAELLLSPLRAPLLPSKCSGTVCGLVVITPASGFVDHTGSFIMALVSTPVVYFGLQFKERVGYDDALDAFGVHGVGGVCGGLLTGFFANDFVSGSPEKRGVFYGKGDQVWIQVRPGRRRSSRAVCTRSLALIWSVLTDLPSDGWF